MGLFSKKPGGTFFGNLLRGVANKATGGILGNGLNKIELGQTKTNRKLLSEPIGFSSGRGTTSNPINLAETTISSESDSGFKDHTFIGKLFNEFRGEAKQFADDVQPKVGLSDKTLLIGGAVVLLITLLITNKSR